MTAQASSWVWEHSAHKGTNLLVLLCLANYVGLEDGSCWVGIKRIAKDTRMSERAVQYSLRKLEASKEIEVEKQAGGHGANLYRLVGVQGLHHAESAPVQAVAPEPSTALVSTKGSISTGVKNLSPVGAGFPEPVRTLCQRLSEYIESNIGRPTPVSLEWLRCADRLFRIDAVDAEEALQVLHWCQAVSDFWPANILSMTKFRKQYPRLKMQMIRDGRPRVESGNVADRAYRAGREMLERSGGNGEGRGADARIEVARGLSRSRR